MKRAWGFVAVLLCFLLMAAVCLGGCAAPQGDFFAPFSAGYRAQLRGNFRGVEFEGLLELSAPTPTGERAATFTFYAPQTLKDTALLRGADGTLVLQSGEVRVDGRAFAPLLDAFPTAGEVREVTVENGRTRIAGADFVLELLENGTPTRIERAELSAAVLFFERTA